MLKGFKEARHKQTKSCFLVVFVPRVAAAIRGKAAGILEKSHKVEKIWKKFNLKQYFLVFTNK